MIALSTNVAAIEYNDTSYLQDGSSSNLNELGAVIQTNINSTLTAVQLHDGSTATTVKLKDAGDNLLASATVVGKVATFNYPLTEGTIYKILADDGGVFYTRTWANGVFPKVGDSITFLQSGGPPYNRCDNIGVCNIYAVITTVAEAPVNYTLTVTANDTATSNPINDFCVGVGAPSSCTTNGTVYFVEQDNNTAEYFANSTGYDNLSTNITIAGDTGYTLQFIAVTPPPIPVSAGDSHAFDIAVVALSIGILMIFGLSAVPKMPAEAKKVVFVGLAILGLVIVVSLLSLL